MYFSDYASHFHYEDTVDLKDYRTFVAYTMRNKRKRKRNDSKETFEETHEQHKGGKFPKPSPCVNSALNINSVQSHSQGSSHVLQPLSGNIQAGVQSAGTSMGFSGPTEIHYVEQPQERQQSFNSNSSAEIQVSGVQTIQEVHQALDVVYAGTY